MKIAWQAESAASQPFDSSAALKKFLGAVLAFLFGTGWDRTFE
jgi:hypothetical protein